MNKINAVYVSILALIIGLAALVACYFCCCNKKEVKEPLTQEEITAILTENPQIIINAMQNYDRITRENAQKEAAKKIQENIGAITNSADAPVLGNPNGSVVVVEFFDYACGYCHKLYPSLMNVVEKNPDVKLVLRALSFVSPSSKYAAKAGLAANEQGKYKEFFDGMMNHNGQLSEAKIDEIAVKAGVDLERMKTDMNSEKVNQTLNNTSDLAAKISVSGVPALVIGGRIVQTLDESVIQDAINASK